MIVTFGEDYLRDLYETGKTTDKKHRFQPEIISRYRERIKNLENAKRIEDLFVINSLEYKVLDGDKAGISSIRINRKYRIEFVVINNEIEPFITICNILELSNHYK